MYKATAAAKAMAVVSSQFPKDLPTAAWQARALELAQQRHLTGVARFLGIGVHGSRLYQVRSRTLAANHIVTHYLRTDAYTCDCLAGAHSRACSHAGAAIYAERLRAAAERETGPSEEWRYWKHTTD
jgi:hypothetical protein